MQTTEPGPPRSWIVVDDGSDGLVASSLQRFGSIYRLGLGAGPPDAPRSGDRVALVRTDRSRVVGLWAMGQAVAEPLQRGAGQAALAGEPASVEPAGARTYAEVELLPTAKPIPLAELAAIDVLAPAVAQIDAGARLVELSRAQRAALEGLDVWLEEPTDEQRLALDDLLAIEDDVLDAEG